MNAFDAVTETCMAVSTTHDYNPTTNACRKCLPLTDYPCAIRNAADDAVLALNVLQASMRADFDAAMTGGRLGHFD